jgi:hypothetical protein
MKHHSDIWDTMAVDGRKNAQKITVCNNFFTSVFEFGFLFPDGY